MASTVPTAMQATVPATQGQAAAQTQATTQAIIQTKFPAAAITSAPHPPGPVGSRYNFTHAFALNGLTSDGNLLFATRPITKRTPLVYPTADNVNFWLKELASSMIDGGLATPFDPATPHDPDAVASMTLQAFPRGYKLWVHEYYEKDGITMRRDIFLWGHPSGQPFRSPGRFYKHLEWLVKGQPENPEQPENPCPCERPKKCGE